MLGAEFVGADLSGAAFVRGRDVQYPFTCMQLNIVPLIRQYLSPASLETISTALAYQTGTIRVDKRVDILLSMNTKYPLPVNSLLSGAMSLKNDHAMMV